MSGKGPRVRAGMPEPGHGHGEAVVVEIDAHGTQADADGLAHRLGSDPDVAGVTVRGATEEMPERVFVSTIHLPGPDGAAAQVRLAAVMRSGRPR